MFRFHMTIITSNVTLNLGCKSVAIALVMSQLQFNKDVLVIASIHHVRFCTWISKTAECLICLHFNCYKVSININCQTFKRTKSITRAIARGLSNHASWVHKGERLYGCPPTHGLMSGTKIWPCWWASPLLQKQKHGLSLFHSTLSRHKYGFHRQTLM